MASRKRLKQLAKRAEGLLAAIRAEIDEAASASALPATGVLSFLDEAASLLHRAVTLVEGRSPETEQETGEDAVLHAEHLQAAIRYVAVQAPSLAPALAWAVSASPALVATLQSRPPASGELAALAALDEALEAVVQASPAGLRHSGRLPRQPGGAEEPAPPTGPLTVTAADVARCVRDVARIRPSLVPACLWLIQRRPASRLAVGAYCPKPEELAELAAMAGKSAESEPVTIAVEAFHVAEAEAQESFVSLAVKLAELRGKIRRLRHGVDRGWPEAMFEGTMPPTLAFELFGAADTLIEEYLDPAIETARYAAEITEESVRAKWKGRRRRWKAERTAWPLGDYAETADPEEP